MENRKPKTKRQKEEFLRMAARQFAEILIAEIERRKEEEYNKRLAKKNK